MDNRTRPINDFKEDPNDKENEKLPSPLLQISLDKKTSAFNWQERRHPDWTENYLLYRDKVSYNRLTQRQSVNLPLMKTAVKTALKDVDDMPLLYFEILSEDKDIEIEFNEYYSDISERNNLEIQDIVDKKQVFLYGRSFKKLNIVNGHVYSEILDPQDVLIDRYADPARIDSARYICHQHIFRPVSSLEANGNYDKDAVARLKTYLGTKAGLIKADNNNRALQDKNERMQGMGVKDVNEPRLGETYAELNEHYIQRWNETNKEDEFWLVVIAEDREVLLEKRLEEVLDSQGSLPDHFWRYNTPIISWADDVERADIWSDAMADSIRTPNKVLNVWFSQLAENRTLRSLGMHFYKQTEGFAPQTWTPEAFGWYELPDDPKNMLQRVDIPALEDSIEDMNFVITLAEKASAATSIQQGVAPERKITLGEVQLIMANATDRVKAMSKFYTASWKEFGLKLTKLIMANRDRLDPVTLYKKGLYNDKTYEKEVDPSNWSKKLNWRVKVVTVSEREDQQLQAIQKLNAVIKSIPNNPPLIEIYQQKLVEFAGCTPEQAKAILDFEKQKNKQIENSQGMPGTPSEVNIPQVPAVAGDGQGTPQPGMPAA